MYRIRHLAREVAANVAMGVPAIRGLRVRRGRTTGASLDDKAREILAQFAFFVGTIGVERLRGRTVLEVGPGDAIPLAPLFLGLGAARYVALDRFLGDVAGADALALYDTTIRHAPAAIVERLRTLGCDGGTDGLLHLLRDVERIRLIDRSVEEDAPALHGCASLIVSFNVCEHLADVERAMANMASMLAPEGCMIHRVDYGPHDVWLQYRNPLTFLTVPAPLWRLMSSNRGCPNRVRHAQLMRIAAALGLQVTDRVSQRADASSVSEVRPHLPPQFAGLSDPDLGVLDAEIVCSLGPPPRLGPAFALEADAVH